MSARKATYSPPAKKKLSPGPQTGAPRAVDPRVAAELERMRALSGLTLMEITQRIYPKAKNASALLDWQSGYKEPSFIPFCNYVEAAGLHVRVVPQSVANAIDEGNVDSLMAGGNHVRDAESLFDEFLKMGAAEQEKVRLLFRVHEKGAANPQEPGELAGQ